MMSRTVSGWILSSAKNTFTVVRRERRWFSKCILNTSSPKGHRYATRAVSRTSLVYPLHQIVKTVSHTSTEEDVHFNLYPTQINYILRANELTYKIPDSKSTILKFDSNQLASNTPSEDRRSAATCLHTKGNLFGVFDGHAGSACAQSISERLFYYIAVSLMSQETLEEIEFAREHMKPVLPILQWHKHKNDNVYKEVASLYVDHLRVYWQELLHLDNESGMKVVDAMSYAFQRLDSDISLAAQAPTEDELVRNLMLQIAFSGATACVSHINGVDLTIANTGDSRAVLGVQDESGTWSAVPLTSDHNALNSAELQRVKSEHPPSEGETVVTEDRLLGILMPLRAFGDVRFKWSQDLQKSVLHNACGSEPLNIYQYSPANYHTPPYLTAAPEITTHKLRPQDRFLIMATDGLWDMLEEQEVVKLVAEQLSEINQQEPEISVEKRSLGYMQNLLLKRRTRGFHMQDQNVATHLIRHAIGSNENGELEQEKLAAMLSLPEDLSRMYRDDITVTVVFFNSNAIEAHYKENEDR
uniref:[Pyruvate dehydrogenase [acetyl-transferring]]-phosphatase 2, mitochondrial n=1 Tax=Leptobrachium leishanense TaxID=445787 RepID=A0A8C5PMQ7_9ANUR